MLILVHATKVSSELIKLLAFSLLGQYLLCFPLDTIERLAGLEIDRESVYEFETMLDQFRSFELLQLDDLVNEVYESIRPLYCDKEYKNPSGLKLEQVIVKTGNNQELVFNYSFCHVFIKG